MTKLSTTSNQLQQDRLTLSEQRDGVRYITLNNAKKRNALSTALMDSIIENMTHDIDDVHVIVLRAVGSVFSAGHDMTEVTHERGEQYHKEVFKKCETMMKLVQDIPVPVIAQVRDTKIHNYSPLNRVTHANHYCMRLVRSLLFA